MDMMQIRRNMMGVIAQMASGGGGIPTVTITNQQTTVKGCFDAVWDAIGASHTRWFAWVDDSTYPTLATNYAVAMICTPNDIYRQVYRTDSSYGRMRAMGYTGSATTACYIPANTVFKYVIVPDPDE